MPRQRHDLTVKPGVKDEFGRYIPTPLFVPSAEGYTGLTPPEKPPFAQLLWSPPNRKGEQREVCAHSPAEVAEYVEQGYFTTPPHFRELSDMERIQAQFDALSPEDQKFLLEQQAKDKKERLRELLASLSDDDMAQLMGKSEKRGPGRPKKISA